MDGLGMEKPGKPWWRKLLGLLLLAAVVYGVYYAWTTGELLKLLNWLLGQDVVLLTIIAVIGLVALAMMMGG
jgi:hypothetical protein